MNDLETTAQLFGLAPNTLRRWIRQGAPVVESADKGRGIPSKLDFAAIANWAIDRAVRDAIAETQTDGGNISREEADRRKAVANAVVAEVEADDALKSVVSRHDADGVVADFLTALRAGLSPAAGHIAHATATMTDPNAIREYCEAEINRSMQSAQAALATKWARERAA